MDHKPLIAGLLGGALALVSGRRETRFENFLVGALFTGFSAYRDPRASNAALVGVASAQGVAWGVADRAVAAGMERAGLSQRQGERT